MKNGSAGNRFKILFVSHNTHQTRYFKRLISHLNYKSTLKVSPKSFSIFSTRKLAREIPVNHILKIKFSEIDLKYKYKIHNMLYKYILKLKTPFIVSGYIRDIVRNQPDLVVFWNGKKYPQNIGVEIAKLLGKQTLFFENGALPNTTAMDFYGLNATASIPQDAALYAKYKYTKALPKVLQPRKEERKRIKNEQILPEVFVFVPFQVGYDTQIIYHSPWIDSMHTLFAVIETLSERLEMHFILKEHPSDKKNNYDTLHRKTRVNPYIKFANEHKTQDLIEKSVAILTINSSVGIEGMLFNKRIIVLGEAFYAIEGIAKSANTIEEVESILRNVESWRPNAVLLHQFLAYLLECYYLPDSWRNPTQIHFDAVNQKLEKYITNDIKEKMFFDKASSD